MDTRTLALPGRSFLSIAETSLSGWIHSVDRDGVFTLRSDGRLIHVTCGAAASAVLRECRAETVVRIEGVSPDPNGDGVSCEELQVLNDVGRLPFTAATRMTAAPATRARFRYLEFRDPEVRALLAARHAIMRAMSASLDERGFIGVDTPILAVPSASGAREFRVASSRSSAVPYALPQSAQVYGQLTVIGGFERYYQWSRCFRDEDLRGNRQPEFTQLHIEMAFVPRATLIETIENLIAAGCMAAGLTPPAPIPQLSFADAMARYATDKPDLRFDLNVRLLPYLVEERDQRGDRNLIALSLPPWVTPDLADLATIRGLATAGGFNLVGFLDPGLLGRRFVSSKLTADTIATQLPVLDEWSTGREFLFLGCWKSVDDLTLRTYGHLMATKRPPADARRWIWIDRFPMFAEEAGEPGRLGAVNSPFTAPEDEAALMVARKHRDLLRLESQAFDLVLNGEELASGSILIHRADVQKHVFNVLGLTRREVRASYGFVLDALDAGAPPMGGAGIGFDRLVTSLCGRDKIRDLIAFPKTKQGYCPVTGGQSQEK